MMNGIGIDYQQTLSVIGLREGDGLTARTRLIGDGWRRLVPHTALSDGRWGTEAAMANSLSSTADILPGGPWFDDVHLPCYWRGLYGRVRNYLGGVQPVPKSQFRVVVAMPCEIDSEEAHRVRNLVEGTEWEHVQWIRTTDALVCRWLASPTRDMSKAGTVVAVVAGDTSLTLAAYRVVVGSNERLSVSATTPLIRLDDIGHWYWSQAVLSEVRRRLPEPPSLADELALRDSVLEFASALRRTASDTPVSWTGALNDRLFAMPTWTHRELGNSLPLSASVIAAAAQRQARELSASERPAVILVGGIGAAWPFLSDALKHLAPIWQMPAPEEDVALGAAWWPIFGFPVDVSSHVAEPFDASFNESFDEPPSNQDFSSETDVTSSELAGELTSGRDEIPPWQR
ncbi:MAG: hypothetical protein ACKV2Q_29415 [Planctomycetaceae bacterium]